MPSVDGGRYPAKRIAGEPCVVEADIFRDGHQVLRAAIKWRRKQDEAFDEAPMAALDNDRWRGEFIPTDNARYVFTIEAWTDLFASWLGGLHQESEGRAAGGVRCSRGNRTRRENEVSCAGS